jgi:hypothetical protein
VPDTDRGLEENRFTSIEELVASIEAHPSDDPCLSAEQYYHSHDAPAISALGPEPTGHDGDSDGDGNGNDVVYETLSSGMFPLDRPAAFAEADKLSFLVGTIQTD